MLTGTFPLATDLTVSIGGVAAYGGQGFGTLPQSQDGVTLSVSVPPLSPGDHQVAVIEEGEESVPAGALTILEHNWASKTFSMRSNFPPLYAVGPRTLGSAPLICPEEDE